MILKCAIYCAIFSLPLYSWTKVYKEWKKIREELKKHSLYLQRHICMGVYSAGVLSGWPTEDRAEKSKGFNINTQFEPILYFIRTAERSLDIAIMFIQIKSILDELLAASRRNVKVRIIVDYNYNNNKDLRHLERSGIEVLYYVAPDPDISTIFHHKYMVKDYTDEDGYLYIGSVNWSVGGVTVNYETFNFIVNRGVVKYYHEKFHYAWHRIREINETSLYAKGTLTEIS